MTTPFRFSMAALAGDLNAITQEAHDAGWKIKIKHAPPEENVVCAVDIALRDRQDLNSGTGFMDPYSGESGGWYCGSKYRLEVYGETVVAAASRLNEVLEALARLQAGG